ncbi:MAG TPA: UvrD-helicase domain-containing protein, partial [Candidatus Binataceae bacterium]|nr:UvrD-helicase domain-containing protein [Candidatus Binataceae bacterium]
MAPVKLDDLNPAQYEAVTAGDGPILILAGAGSGKTRVLTYRIAYLLTERKLAPEQLLAVTFTNKAAAEMRERLTALLGAHASRLWIATFHSACARILRQDIERLGYRRNFTVFDESDSASTINRAIEAANLSGAPNLAAVRVRIDQAKNEGLAPADLAAVTDGGSDTAVIAEIYRIYQQRLRELNAVDFGDLLLLVHQLFDLHPDVLERWRARFNYLLVDEYQDTNRVQYLLLRALAAGQDNICVVGDEDQSIYRWRGADIRNILEFERDFPAAQIFKLEQNYRSTQTILKAAHTVIVHNRERKEKELWTENERGEPVTCYTGTTERDEADYIGREVGLLCQELFKPSDVVVFYRTNAQSRVIEEALVRRRIPYYVVGGLRFYDQREIKDLLAYLRVISNPADAVSLNRLIGTPPRGIGARSIEAMEALGAREKMSLFDALGRAETESSIALRISRQITALHEWLRNLVGAAPTMTVRAILEEIIDRSGYLAYLEGLADGSSRRESVTELLSAASTFDAEAGPGGLGEFLERVALVSDADQVAARGGSVALMTLHTCKGLEYPVVFIAGMEEGLFPHNRSQGSPSEIEEERRLLYVGMTRARRLLYLTNTLSRELYGNRQESRPSRFLAEIDPALIRRAGPPPRNAPIRMP